MTKYFLMASLVFLSKSLAAQSDSSATDINNELQVRGRFADRFSIGLESGYTKNYLLTDISNLSFTEYKPLSGYSISIPLEYKVRDWFAIYSGPSIIKKNYEYSRTDFFQGVHEDYLNTYLQVPLMGKFKFGGKRLKGFVTSGIYGGYWIAARIKGTIPNPLDPNTGSSNTNNPTSIFDEMNPYSFNEKYNFNTVKDNRLEFGWVLGLGINYQLNKAFQVFIEARTTQSMTDHQKQYMTSQVPQYNQTYGVSAGFLMNIKSIFTKKSASQY